MIQFLKALLKIQKQLGIVNSVYIVFEIQLDVIEEGEILASFSKGYQIAAQSSAS